MTAAFTFAILSMQGMQCSKIAQKKGDNDAKLVRPAKEKGGNIPPPPAPKEFLELDASQFHEFNKLNVQSLRVIRKHAVKNGFEYSILVTFKKDYAELGDEHICALMNAIFRIQAGKYIQRSTGDEIASWNVEECPFPLILYQQLRIHEDHKDTPQRLVYMVSSDQKK